VNSEHNHLNAHRLLHQHQLFTLYFYVLLSIVLLVRLLRAQFAANESMADFPDLETTRQQEAERRLRMLGPLANTDCSRKQLRERAHAMHIPSELLMNWNNAYQNYGLDGLLPDWAELSHKDIEAVLGCVDI
jgi:hypothetical protein